MVSPIGTKIDSFLDAPIEPILQAKSKKSKPEDQKPVDVEATLKTPKQEVAFAEKSVLNVRL